MRVYDMASPSRELFDAVVDTLRPDYSELYLQHVCDALFDLLPITQSDRAAGDDMYLQASIEHVLDYCHWRRKAYNQVCRVCGIQLNDPT